MATLKSPAEFDASELHSAIKVNKIRYKINDQEQNQLIISQYIPSFCHWFYIVKVNVC